MTVSYSTSRHLPLSLDVAKGKLVEYLSLGVNGLPKTAPIVQTTEDGGITAKARDSTSYKLTGDESGVVLSGTMEITAEDASLPSRKEVAEFAFAMFAREFTEFCTNGHLVTQEERREVAAVAVAHMSEETRKALPPFPKEDPLSPAWRAQFEADIKDTQERIRQSGILEVS